MLTFIPYLLEKKNEVVATDSSTRLDVDNLKIQDEESREILSGSDNRNIRNIKLIFSMHTDLIFK
jgi:hypothetical protein